MRQAMQKGTEEQLVDVNMLEAHPENWTLNVHKADNTDNHTANPVMENNKAPHCYGVFKCAGKDTPSWNGVHFFFEVKVT